jgi:hypothetical protein
MKNFENEIKEDDAKIYSQEASKDLVGIGIVLALTLLLSYYFKVFLFIVELFQKNPEALTFLDEIITGLVVISLGFAFFSWRRLKELKKETDKCILEERELAAMAVTHAEAERIVSKQLHVEIEQLMKFLKEDREILLSKIEKQRFKNL